MWGMRLGSQPSAQDVTAKNRLTMTSRVELPGIKRTCARISEQFHRRFFEDSWAPSRYKARFEMCMRLILAQRAMQH